MPERKPQPKPQRINLKRCAVCRGTGVDENEKPCKRCNGTGQVLA